MPRPSENRLVLPVSFALLENIKIYFEENLANDALDLLQHLVISGKRTTAPPGSRPNSVIPPPSYLDLISTLSIHPRHTTYTKSRDDHQAALNALGYLQLLPALVSVKDSRVGQAFRFEEGRSAEIQRWERGTKRKARVALEGSEAVAFDDDVIDHPIARDSIWTQAKDFWHVVGWAVNCAVWHRRRWEYWQLWLEFMILVMERDLEERIALRDAGEEGEGGRPEESILGRFLLLNEGGESRQVWKRAAKAIFADGSERAMNEFPLVWREETKVPKDDDMEMYKAPSIYRDVEDPSKDWLSRTGPGVRDLRIRLITLLLHISHQTLSTSLSPSSLSDLLASHITHLPYPIYTSLLRASPLDTLPLSSLSTLTQTIASWLIDHAAPANPGPDDAPTQDTLAMCFLPFAANTSSLEDNARLSWAVEILQRMYFDAHRDESPTRAFVKAAEAGIAARAKRVRDAKVRTGVKGEEDEMFRQQMLESSWRMRMLIGAVEEKMVRRKKRAEKGGGGRG
ncbi:hypothetical protein GMDG_05971 [Pseudogymnoascus destructans 20631-21]|uniref:Uncharacterized protein n=1 Tax=Pseudogymnoascus destructans (strain ATCC MYA-4855 / 20631-21) TaxID=658429 RepID=L8FQH6_PSED2|nr:hypothetical protein GMDG_05971 [Pseudogymnoascus destructans 20631-21]